MARLPFWTGGLLAQTRLAAHVQALMRLTDPAGPAGYPWSERAAVLIAAGARWDRPMAWNGAQDLPVAHLARAALHRTDDHPWNALHRVLAAGATPDQPWTSTAPDGHPWTLWTFLAHEHDTLGLEALSSWGWTPPATETVEHSLMTQVQATPDTSALIDDCGTPTRPPCAPPRARFTTLVWVWRHEHGSGKGMAAQTAALNGDLDVLALLKQEDPGRYDALEALMRTPSARSYAPPEPVASVQA